MSNQEIWGRWGVQHRDLIVVTGFYAQDWHTPSEGPNNAHYYNRSSITDPVAITCKNGGINVQKRL